MAGSCKLSFLPKIAFRPLHLVFRLKSTIDYSKVPQLVEAELEERFVRGSGPGGQSVNKTANNVVLKHVPSGIVVKCHKSRSLDQNRKEARKLMVSKMDEEFNGEASVANQLKAIEKQKFRESQRRRDKLEEMKKKWKERENVD